MNQELLMDFMEDLKEVIQKGEQLMQEMQGGSFGQRGGGYGMRSGSGYGMRGGYGNRGGYGRRGADLGHQIGASQQMGGGDPYSQMPPPYFEPHGQMGPDPRMM
jgi:hypothetical protein